MKPEQQTAFWQAPLSLHLITITARCMIRKRPPHWHQHPFYELSLIVSGECEWALDHEIHPVRPGEALLLPPGQRHAEHVLDGQPCSVIWIGFDADRPMPNWCNRVLSLGDDFEEIVRSAKLLQEESLSDHHFAAERTTLLLQTILLLISRRALGPSPEAPASSPLNFRQRACMNSVALYFRKNLADCLSMAQVAAYHSLCPAYFSRLFQQHHGLTPSAFLHRARLEQSANLLSATTLSVKEIALQCGFSDSAHFCKAFRHHYQQTPSNYRAGSTGNTGRRSPF